MKKFIQEFKKFAVKGNMVDMAVGIIVGSAFTAIVNSLVKDIFMPLLSWPTSGLNLAELNIPLGTGEEAATLNYGAFLTAILNFLLIALVTFFMVKLIQKARAVFEKDETPAPAPKRKCPYCQMEIADEATRCPHCTSPLPGYKNEVNV